MNLRAFCVASLAVLSCASAVFAGAPLPGNYQSTDLGGPIAVGRYTEGWASGGGAMLPGTTLNGQSWNGSALGTEWKYWCATEALPAVLQSDNTDANGNGSRTWKKTFTGGYLWLSGTGPWGNGDPDYPGLIDNYIEYETIQYMGNVAVAAVTNISATGHFVNYPLACLAFAIANGARIGGSPAAKPAGYPDLLSAGSCAPDAPEGAWWNIGTLTLSVSSGCSTPSHASTWGALKAIYR
jgi:hypothetical protein